MNKMILNRSMSRRVAVLFLGPLLRKKRIKNRHCEAEAISNMDHRFKTMPKYSQATFLE